VEFPLGKLERVERHFSKYWDAVHGWPPNRQRYTVEWKVDEVGERLLDPEEWAENPELRGPRPGARKGRKGIRIGAAGNRKTGK
jgi:hypothetical protein